jgi:hypothetical protein
MHTSVGSFHFNLPTIPFHFPEPAQTSRPRLLPVRTPDLPRPKVPNKKTAPGPKIYLRRPLPSSNHDPSPGIFSGLPGW